MMLNPHGCGCKSAYFNHGSAACQVESKFKSNARSLSKIKSVFIVEPCAISKCRLRVRRPLCALWDAEKISATSSGGQANLDEADAKALNLKVLTEALRSKKWWAYIQACWQHRIPLLHGCACGLRAVPVTIGSGPPARKSIPMQRWHWIYGGIILV